MSTDKETLLKMHEFYAQEARHQRSMMWETVKWFTPILTLLLGFWVKYMVDFLSNVSFQLAALLISIAVFGFVLSYIATKLLESFYKSNLIYVTMFVKTQDELGWDTTDRERRTSYEEDLRITYTKYYDDRTVTYSSAADFVEQAVPPSGKMFWENVKHIAKHRKRTPRTGRMYFWMNAVFYLFATIFILAAIFVLYSLLLSFPGPSTLFH